MNDSNDEQLKAALKYSRGAQLRALVMSWQLGDTYQRTLQLQAESLQNGGLVINDDWGDLAEDILAQLSSCQANSKEDTKDGG